MIRKFMVRYWSFNKKIILFLLVFALVMKLAAQNLSIASFSRLGFTSRGIALGNAMASVIQGEITGYYNPAVLPFSNIKSASLTIGVLSLDRTLDFIHYTQSLYPTAGFSIFIIRAGVRNIDSRDTDGYHIENLNTSEYLIGFSFSNRIVQKLSFGLSLKFYISKLYRDISSQTLGFDFGLLFKLSEYITTGISIHDINAKYKWDSSIIYREKGRTVVEKFPLTTRFGITYSIQNFFIASAGYSGIARERIINLGLEIYPFYFLSEQFKQSICVRGGIQFLSRDFSLGFGLNRKISNFTVSFDYAYKFERYSPSGMQLLTIGLKL